MELQGGPETTCCKKNLRINSLVHVLEWPSQSLHIIQIQNTWEDMNIDVQRHSPSILTELELFPKEEY